VVGLKPTYGRVSRWGLVAFASSLDQVGPFTTSVADSAEILQVIAGADRRDSTCLTTAVPDYRAALEQPVKGLRVGLIRECFEAGGLDPQVKASVLAAAAQLERLGCELVDISCPRFNDGIATYYVIAPSEASANLARYDGVKYGLRAAADGGADNLATMTARSRAEGFGDEVQRRILIGTYALSAGYVDAYYLFEKHPRVTAASNVILTNCYPFWEGCPRENAVAYMDSMLQRVRAVAGDKRVIVSETGWPDQGTPFHGAVPSVAGAMHYFIDTQRWSKAADVEVFYFAAFDEAWKVGAEGDVGAYWGLWDSRGEPKFT
jgi:Asp-tRNA(Asn)/Glu-tRNA(Gln) amidotransferase A subunit family amidase